MPGKILEIACFNLESALLAQGVGADRIEFCEDYHSGGISPSIELLDEARKKIKIPLYVMVRPRAGNFIYSEMEIQWMIQYIIRCRLSGIDGIVVGALTAENEIDLRTCSRLIEAAGIMPVTFHRAIDEINNSEPAYPQLINLGFQRILTSGGKGNAIENITQLKNLQTKFGNQIIIMPGGGIRSSNIQDLLNTGCNEYHTAALRNGSALPEKTEIEQLKLILANSNNL